MDIPCCAYPLVQDVRAMVPVLTVEEEMAGHTSNPSALRVISEDI
jgi:hypothetical protein